MYFYLANMVVNIQKNKKDSIKRDSNLSSQKRNFGNTKWKVNIGIYHIRIISEIHFGGLPMVYKCKAYHKTVVGASVEVKPNKFDRVSLEKWGNITKIQHSNQPFTLKTHRTCTIKGVIHLQYTGAHGKTVCASVTCITASWCINQSSKMVHFWAIVLSS